MWNSLGPSAVGHVTTFRIGPHLFLFLQPSCSQYKVQSLERQECDQVFFCLRKTWICTIRLSHVKFRRDATLNLVGLLLASYEKVQTGEVYGSSRCCPMNLFQEEVGDPFLACCADLFKNRGEYRCCYDAACTRHYRTFNAVSWRPLFSLP